MSMIEIGKPAPDFKLYSSNKEEISLSQFSGKNVLILFFPLAYTSVCTEELCSIRDTLSAYSDMNAEVIGISVDSIFTLAKYRDDYSLNFPLLSDFNKEVSVAYNSAYEVFAFGMKGVSKRSAFIVDKNGIIRYAEVLENAGELPNFAAINDTLNQLQ